MNQMFQEAGATVENLKPRMRDLKNSIAELDALFRDHIVQNVQVRMFEANVNFQLGYLQCWQQSADFVAHGLDDAMQLQTLLAMLIDMTQNQSRDLANSHESALQEVTLRMTSEVDVILAALAAAVVSSTSLHREIVSYLCTWHYSSPDRVWLGNLAVRGCSCCTETGEDRDGTLFALTIYRATTKNTSN